MSSKRQSGQPKRAQADGPKPAKKNRPDRDRRVRQSARIARVLRILNLIQSRGRWTTKSIADELECSERTVYRDLDVLEFSGVPYFREPADGAIRVRPDFRFPVLSLNADELTGQAIATAITDAPGLDITDGAKPTTRKLAVTVNNPAQQVIEDASKLIEVLDLKLTDHSRHREVIRTAQQALLTGRQVSGQYESPYESSPARLKLNPYRICLVKNAWYLIARPQDEEAPRTYRLTRFKSLRMLEDAANRPVEFSLRDYFGNAWGVYRGEPTYDVEIRFTPEASKVVTETVWHHTQEVIRHRDGSLSLKFRVDGLQEILNWVMTWTGRGVVVSPPQLRKLVAERLRTAIKDYGE